MSLHYLQNVVTLQLDQELCTGCRRCLEVCPHGVFTLKDKRAHIIDLDACIECGACAKNCAWNAITVQAGVGCAAALLHSKWSKTPVTCGCSEAQCG
jgi:NAD-dependent dihydropyrimidine dehydrogenase PreA subunit